MLESVLVGEQPVQKVMCKWSNTVGIEIENPFPHDVV